MIRVLFRNKRIVLTLTRSEKLVSFGRADEIILVQPFGRMAPPANPYLTPFKGNFRMVKLCFSQPCNPVSERPGHFKVLERKLSLKLFNTSNFNRLPFWQGGEQCYFFIFCHFRCSSMAGFALEFM
ncbi:hypothetical protein H744_1c0553 [Photobacterium gaetbulicola Gung47]|uniref:Uncharacterized protein n=1 Tax=Photobacterium gaetbulicola Gung47 TaxID=658445 RepID=A0A0C5WEM5_9GAMM|nr:hypothetical protein H744_1c0553 [Photobacterium gaetbulicola Gung47]